MPPPLRILHVVPYYEQAWAYGGIPRLATAMTRGLARRGHAVTVCTTDVCDATSRASGSNPGLTPAVHVFPNVSNRLAYHWQLFTPIGLAAYLRAHARQLDVAHLHACRNLPVVIAARALRRAGVPYVLSPNGTAPAIERRIAIKHLFDATIGRDSVRRAARLVAATRAERDQLQRLGVPSARVAVVPNPFDESEFESAPDGMRFRRTHGLEQARIVLFLGKLTPRKGVDVLLRAFRHLAHRGDRLVIAGNDMGSGATIAALVTALGLERCVHRVGLLRGRDRLDALAAADVVVYPSRDEIFGLVAVEALLCGTPVVVCDDSGCGEIVRELGGGRLVPYGSDTALAAAIASILDERPAWDERVRDAAVQARARFRSDAIAQRLEDLYREVLHERHARAA